MRPLAMLFAAILLVTTTFAQTPPPKPADQPSIGIGVTVFSNYTYTAEPTSTDADGNAYNPSSFDVTRAYINVTGKVSRFSFRVTPDIARETGAGSSLNGSLNFRLKYAFTQATLGKSTWIRLGVQQTPYIDYTEGIYRYRFQGTVFADREGYLSSSDFGVSLHYDLPKGYGDVHTGFYNGETYSKPEANNQKAFMTRVSIRPAPKSAMFKGLRTALFYDADNYVSTAERRRLTMQVSYEHPRGTVAAERLQASDQTSASRAITKGEGYSLWAAPKFGRGVEGLLRYDHLQPDTAIDKERTRTILGLAYWFPQTGKASCGVLGDYERIRATGSNLQQRYALHAVFNY